MFQSSAPGERIQVIKTQSVSSSRRIGRSLANEEFGDLEVSFEQAFGRNVGLSPTVRLSSYAGGITVPTTVRMSVISDRSNNDFSLVLSRQFPVNPLDVTSQKSKASVGRSVGRRPPSWPRRRDDTVSSSSTRNQLITTSSNFASNYEVKHQSSTKVFQHTQSKSYVYLAFSRLFTLMKVKSKTSLSRMYRDLFICFSNQTRIESLVSAIKRKIRPHPYTVRSGSPFRLLSKPRINRR